MHAVLPLAQSAAERAARILLPSLRRHYRDLDHLWVVAPKSQLSSVAHDLSAFADSRVTFLSDEELVPEFALHQRWGLHPPRGWYRQQLVKLAIAERMSGEFYLTLDDDLLAVSDFSDRDILRAHRSPRTQDRAAHATRNLPPGSPENLDEWLLWSARVLACEPLDYQPEVTPSILSRSAVRNLAAHLESRCRPRARRWRIAALAGRLGFRPGLASWRGRLLASLPWTEYTLYDTYLVRHADFSRHHYAPDDTLPLGNAAWHARDFDDWRPRSHDALGRRLLFNLVQSRSGISPDQVVSRIRESSTSTR
jgi:hypothetical protein